MGADHIYIKGQRYYLHGTYNSKKRAWEIAQWGRKHGSRYFILPVDSWFSSTKQYRVYFNRII